MAYNQKLAGRIKIALSHLPDVEEKRMFRGVTFMVNGKMCISVSGDELMCRVNPDLHDKLIKKTGCRPVIMKNREYKGFVYVKDETLKHKKDLDFWIGLCLEFNDKAKSSKRKSK